MYKLYKKDSKGLIRSWEWAVAGAQLIETYGLDEGAKVTAKKDVKGKNIGRSNETSPYAQAVQEGKAKYKKKRDEGYFPTIDEAKTNVVILPMLAKDYNKESKKIDWENDVVQSQPKLDGMRALGMWDDTFVSRTGKKIDTLGHLYEELNILRKLLGGIPDGELYAHGLSFQENMKLIKKYRPGETEKVKYHVYDVILDQPFAKRNFKLVEAFVAHKFERIEYVKASVLFKETDLGYVHGLYLKDGYEGTIVRYGDAGYKIGGRSSNLLKYKDFKDITATITDVIPSEARPEQGVLVCGDFKASLKFSHAERAEVLTNKEKYIGQTAEIRFFEYTDEGKPRFPVCVGFRLDK